MKFSLLCTLAFGGLCIAAKASTLTLTTVDAYDNQAVPTSDALGQNVALSSAGGTAFALDVLNNGSYMQHQISHLNDGIYGNSNSWIGNSQNSFVGISLASAMTIDGFAFSRDNLSTDPGGPGGNSPYTDRVAGTYVFEYTTDVGGATASTPDGDWTQIGTVNYDGSGNQYQRHEYSFPAISGVTAVRMLVDSATGNYDDVDELEVYAVPEPGSAALLAIGGCAFAISRRRQSQR